jgi:hypothetical protein
LGPRGRPFFFPEDFLFLGEERFLGDLKRLFLDERQKELPSFLYATLHPGDETHAIVSAPYFLHGLGDL